MSLERELDAILNIGSMLAFQVCFTCRIHVLRVTESFYSVFSNDVNDVKRHKLTLNAIKCEGIRS